MTEAREVREARVALEAAEARLTPEERERRREAGLRRMNRVKAAGSYRASLRDSEGRDAVERR